MTVVVDVTPACFAFCLRCSAFLHGRVQANLLLSANTVRSSGASEAYKVRRCSGCQPWHTSQRGMVRGYIQEVVALANRPLQSPGAWVVVWSEHADPDCVSHGVCVCVCVCVRACARACTFRAFHVRSCLVRRLGIPVLCPWFST